MIFNTPDEFERDYLELSCVDGSDCEFGDCEPASCGDDEVEVNCGWFDSVSMAWQDDSDMFECSDTGDDTCCPYKPYEPYEA